jgi:hypothetical protein
MPAPDRQSPPEEFAGFDASFPPSTLDAALRREQVKIRAQEDRASDGVEIAREEPQMEADIQTRAVGMMAERCGVPVAGLSLTGLDIHDAIALMGVHGRFYRGVRDEVRRRIQIDVSRSQLKRIIWWATRIVRGFVSPRDPMWGMEQLSGRVIGEILQRVTAIVEDELRLMVSGMAEQDILHPREYRRAMNAEAENLARNLDREILSPVVASPEGQGGFPASLDPVPAAATAGPSAGAFTSEILAGGIRLAQSGAQERWGSVAVEFLSTMMTVAGFEAWRWISPGRMLLGERKAAGGRVENVRLTAETLGGILKKSMEDAPLHTRIIAGDANDLERRILREAEEMDLTNP